MGETLPMVVPVRYSGGGLTMQTTTSRVGMEELFVRGVVTPRENTRLAVRLTLPDGAQLDLHGSVAERIPPGQKGKEAGFWVRYEPLSVLATEALGAALHDRNTPAGGVKRAFARQQTRLQVGWASPKEFLVAYADNISAGGIFVVTQDPPQLHEVVEISLQLPDGEAPAKTSAEVIQRITPDQAHLLGSQPGAGLQFVGADDEFRRRLDLCIDNLWKAPA